MLPFVARVIACEDFSECLGLASSGNERRWRLVLAMANFVLEIDEVDTDRCR
jgi:hypothetical protein